MKNIISKAILIVIISYLSACKPPSVVVENGIDTPIIATPTDFNLRYNNASRNLSWQAVGNYFYQIEYSPQPNQESNDNFTTYNTSTNTVLAIPKNISGEFRLKLCANITALAIECSAPSNSVSVGRAIQLFIGKGSLFWDDVAVDSYRVEQQSIEGDSYQLLQDTTGTSTVLPRPLPYAVRLQSCDSSNNCTPIDERVLNNLAAVADSWINTTQEINGSIPNNLNAKLTTDYRNRPNQALVLDNNSNWQINYNNIDFALSMWLQPSNINATLIERMVDADSYWRLDMVAGGLQLRVRQTATAPDNSYTITATIAGNQWQHIFLQYNSSNQSFRIAVDGQMQAIVLTNAEKARVEAVTATISIGNSSAANAENYLGKLDKLQLLNRSLFDNYTISNIMISNIMDYDILANWLLAFHNISSIPVAIAPASTTTLAEDSTTTITLSGSDADGAVSALTYQITAQPNNGVATINGNIVTYTPNANYNGSDSFAFSVTDGDNATSEPAIVNIAISPVNDAPSIVNKLVLVAIDTPRIFTLATTDIDGDAVTIESVSTPSIGTLTELDPSNNQYQYVTQDGTEIGASDSITVTISDGTITVTEVIVFSIVLTLPPEADTTTATIAEDSSFSFTLTASDPDGNDNLITYQITQAQQPTNGTVFITGNTAVYTPNTDFFGVDVFYYNAVDEKGALSADTTITVIVSNIVQMMLSVADNSETSISLSWNSGNYFKLYRVNANNATTLIYQGTAQQYTDSGLTATTAYSYQIAYCTDADSCEPLSATLDTATIPKLPVAEQWTQLLNNAPWSRRSNHSSVVFDDKIWVIGGYDGSGQNDVWYSSDGINWTAATEEAPWSGRSNHSSVVFNNKIWVIGGYGGSNQDDVWYSSDGINWTAATEAAPWSWRSSHSSVVFDNKIWVIGGASGDRQDDVWYSSDGSNWIVATEDAPWSGRTSHSSVVFDDKIWVIGGYDGIGFGGQDDVWYSSDGVTWTTTTASATWSGRSSHSSVVFDDKIWVIGGFDVTGNWQDDVWYSSSGVTWTAATTSAPWSGRSNHSSVVFNDKIWVIGGNDDSTNGSNSMQDDVWQSQSINFNAVAQSVSQIQLSWDAIDGASIYRVYRSTQVDGVYIALDPVSTTAFTDSSLNASTKYYYQIAACTLDNTADSTGTSCRDRTRSIALTSAITWPSTGATYTFSYENSATASTISWTVSEGFYYRLYAATTANGTYSQIYAGTNSYFQRSALASATSHYYKLRICTDSSEASCLAVADAEVDSTITTPNLTSNYALTLATSSTSQIAISWDSVLGATYYSLYSSTASDSGFNSIYTNTEDGGSYSHSDLKSGTTYYYRLEVCADSNDVDSCAFVTASAGTTPSDDASYTLTFSHNSNINVATTISWTVSDGSYFILQSSTDSNNFSNSYSGTASYYFDDTVEPAVTYTYFFQLCAGSASNNSCLAVANASTVQTTTPPRINSLENWTAATENAPWSGRNSHSSVVFDNKIWVIGGYDIGYENDVWYSSYGSSWKAATEAAPWPGRNRHSSVVFDNKIWVIGGYSNNDNSNIYEEDVWYSSDGINWTVATEAAPWSGRFGHTSVVFDNKIWVIGGSSSSDGYKEDVWYSSDGSNWTAATENASWSGRSNHSSVVFDDKIWVIGGYSSSGSREEDVWYSNDGSSWTAATEVAPWSGRNRHSSVVFDNKIWVIGGGSSSDSREEDVWYSSDGSNWTAATENASWAGRYQHSSIVFDNKIWVIGGWSSRDSREEDVWHSQSINLNAVAQSSSQIQLNWDATAGASIYRVYRSTQVDGVYTELNSVSSTAVTDSGLDASTKYYYQISACSLSVVADSTANSCSNRSAFSAQASYYTAPSATASYTLSFSHSDTATTISWTVTAGDYFVLQSSTNLSTYTTIYSGTNSFYYSNNLTAASTYTYRLQLCSNSADSCLAAADASTVTTATAPIIPLRPAYWQQQTASAHWTARSNHSAVAYNDKIWVFGGSDGSNDNEVWSSEDGITWQQATINGSHWSERRSHTSLVFNNKIWLLGGQTNSERQNDVWSSSDGSTWIQVVADADWTGRHSHNSLVFDNKMWVMAGFDGSIQNDVWSSADGITWTENTAANNSSTFSTRYTAQAVTYNGKMWLLGGRNATSRLNDVWSSSDGINWTQVTNSASWSVRSEFKAVVFDNKIWVMGGYNGSSRLNDIWYSSDGINWTQQAISNIWSVRDDFTSVVFDGQLWVLGGTDGTRNNQVWQTKPLLTTSATTDTVTISWDAVMDASYYRLYGSTQINGIYNQVYAGSNTGTTNINLQPSSDYYYRLSACTLAIYSTSCSAQFGLVAVATTASTAGKYYAKLLADMAMKLQSYGASSVADAYFVPQQNLSSETIIGIDLQSTGQTQIDNESQLDKTKITSCFTTTNPKVSTSTIVLNWLQPTTDGSMLDNYQSYRWGGIVYGDWDAVIEYANNNQLCGFDNWHIPTAKQLQQLATKYTEFDTLQQVIPNLLPDLYWTTDGVDDSNALAFDFSSWQLLVVAKHSYQRVILIRN